MVFMDVEKIREKFVKDGWSESISFEELSLDEAKEKGYSFAIDGISKGEKYFKMNVSGNIYSSKGEILLYNIS